MKSLDAPICLPDPFYRPACLVKISIYCIGPPHLIAFQYCGAASKVADLMGLKSPAVNFPVRTASISSAPFW
jgi:hypothetical protein